MIQPRALDLSATVSGWYRFFVMVGEVDVQLLNRSYRNVKALREKGRTGFFPFLVISTALLSEGSVESAQRVRSQG